MTETVDARKPDYKWFSDRIRDKGLTQRAFAKLIGEDPSTVSNLIRGKRRMRVSQASEIARVLGVPVSEVVRAAGMYASDMDDGRSIPVVGYVDGDEMVDVDWSRDEFSVDLDVDLPGSAVALQWRTAGTHCEAWDGWLVAVLPPRPPDASQMVDRYCVAKISGGATVIRKVRRGYAPERFNLSGFMASAEHNVELEWFAPVLLIRPI